MDKIRFGHYVKSTNLVLPTAIKELLLELATVTTDDNAGDQFALHQKSKRGKLTGVLPYFLLRPDVVKAARHKVM